MDRTQVILSNDFELLTIRCDGGRVHRKLSFPELFEDIEEGSVPLSE